MTLRAVIAESWLAGHKIWHRLFVSPPPGSFRILLVHDIPTHRARAFEGLIEYIAKTCGFTSPLEAENRLAGNLSGHAEKRIPCLLTFDDGFVSQAEMAQAVLARHGIKAVFFICPGLIDLPATDQPAAIAHHIFADSMMVDEVRARALSLMDWGTLAVLREAGHMIGAHTLTHKKLPALNDKELVQEIKGSRDRIEQALGSAPSWFATPYGDIDSIDRAALAVIGEHFRYCRSGVRGLNTPRTHRLGLLAESVDCSASPAWRRLEIAGALDFRYRDARAHLAAMLRSLD